MIPVKENSRFMRDLKRAGMKEDGIREILEKWGTRQAISIPDPKAAAIKKLKSEIRTAGNNFSRPMAALDWCLKIDVFSSEFKKAARDEKFRIQDQKHLEQIKAAQASMPSYDYHKYGAMPTWSHLPGGPRSIMQRLGFIIVALHEYIKGFSDRISEGTGKGLSEYRQKDVFQLIAEIFWAYGCSKEKFTWQEVKKLYFNNRRPKKRPPFRNPLGIDDQGLFFFLD